MTSNRKGQPPRRNRKNGGARSKTSADTPRHAQGRPTNIASAVVIKDEELFLLCETSGGIPLGNEQGFGLYYHDCRFLNGYEVAIGGFPPNALAVNSERGFMAEFELTNRDLKNSGKKKNNSPKTWWLKNSVNKELTAGEDSVRHSS